MLKKVFLFILLFIGISALTISCKKDSDDKDGGSGNVGFYVKENNGAESQLTAVANAPYKTIVATNSDHSITVEINLQSLDAATYTINATNAVTYLKNSTMWVASSGSVTITSYSNNKISGTFSTTGTGSVTSLSGHFTDIAVTN